MDSELSEMLEPFVPEVLELAGVEELYLPLMGQIEAEVAQSWQACVLAPEDRAVTARYTQRLGRLLDLRADYDRLRAILRPAAEE